MDGVTPHLYPPSMVVAARSPATYQDVLDAPEHMVAELVDGALYLQPRPAKPHTHTASSLGAQLHVAFQLGRGGPGGWWILYEPELHLGPDVLVPDVAGWLRASVPRFDRALAYYEEVPVWVAEVLSESTETLDRTKKLPVYHRAGVEWVWFLHPEQTTLEVLRRERGGYRTTHRWTRGDSTTPGSTPLPPFDADLDAGLDIGGWALDVEALWMAL